MLVNPRLVRKSIAADNRLVWLHIEPDDARQQLTRRIKLSGLDVRLEGQSIGAYVQRHHDLFERRVARALADAVDSALDLSSPCFDRRETVCHRESKIVVTVNADDHVSIPHDALAYLLDQ